MSVSRMWNMNTAHQWTCHFDSKWRCSLWADVGSGARGGETQPLRRGEPHADSDAQSIGEEIERWRRSCRTAVFPIPCVICLPGDADWRQKGHSPPAATLTPQRGALV